MSIVSLDDVRLADGTAPPTGAARTLLKVFDLLSGRSTLATGRRMLRGILSAHLDKIASDEELDDVIRPLLERGLIEARESYPSRAEVGAPGFRDRDEPEEGEAYYEPTAAGVKAARLCAGMENPNIRTPWLLGADRIDDQILVALSLGPTTIGGVGLWCCNVPDAALEAALKRQLDSGFVEPTGNQNPDGPIVRLSIGGELQARKLKSEVLAVAQRVTATAIVQQPASTAGSERRPMSPQPDRTKVFVIHGRNVGARTAVDHFLKALKLEPLDFDELSADMGTEFVGNIVVEGLRRAHGIVALFTPDEYAALAPTFSAERSGTDVQRWQSRPNVIFEAGIAFGIARERTVLVTLGEEVSLFSDVAGVHILRLTNSVESRGKFRQKLIGIRCDLDQRTNAWTEVAQSGDFEAPLRGLSGVSPKDPFRVDVTPANVVAGSDDLARTLALRSGQQLAHSPTMGRAGAMPSPDDIDPMTTEDWQKVEEIKGEIARYFKEHPGSTTISIAFDTTPRRVWEKAAQDARDAGWDAQCGGGELTISRIRRR